MSYKINCLLCFTLLIVVLQEGISEKISCARIESKLVPMKTEGVQYMHDLYFKLSKIINIPVNEIHCKYGDEFYGYYIVHFNKSAIKVLLRLLYSKQLQLEGLVSEISQHGVTKLIYLSMDFRITGLSESSEILKKDRTYSITLNTNSNIYRFMSTILLTNTINLESHMLFNITNLNIYAVEPLNGYSDIVIFNNNKLAHINYINKNYVIEYCYESLPVVCDVNEKFKLLIEYSSQCKDLYCDYNFSICKIINNNAICTLKDDTLGTLTCKYKYSINRLSRLILTGIIGFIVICIIITIIVLFMCFTRMRSRDIIPVKSPSFSDIPDDDADETYLGIHKNANN
ncbi:hypothetical protein A3Q56_04749 [Intoshia linei]|uniref:EGF-like domain-containing protein n=1 Tax=Intoshia linei TaxID=1819745 RepID=A0A177B068_9BILA|nr:hypothetical protein A3Q56_04749 [Intoshia linei]